MDPRLEDEPFDLAWFDAAQFYPVPSVPGAGPRRAPPRPAPRPRRGKPIPDDGGKFWEGKADG